MFYLFTDEEIQTIIRDQFGRPDYRLVFTEEWHTDCDYQFQYARKGANTQNDREEIKRFRLDGGTSPAFMMLLCALIDEEFLPEGNYLISVS